MPWIAHIKEAILMQWWLTFGHTL